MIERPVRRDEQKDAIWYYYACGCAFEAVTGHRAPCPTHRLAPELLQACAKQDWEWEVVGMLRRANRDLAERFEVKLRTQLDLLKRVRDGN